MSIKLDKIDIKLDEIHRCNNEMKVKTSCIRLLFRLQLLQWNTVLETKICWIIRDYDVTWFKIIHMVNDIKWDKSNDVINLSGILLLFVWFYIKFMLPDDQTRIYIRYTH